MPDRPAPPPYRIARKVDLTRMSPATSGTHRTCPADFVGGRMDGISATAGWHPVHRDEVGREIDAETARKIHCYILFTDDTNNLLLHYVHSSLLPPDPE